MGKADSSSGRQEGGKKRNKARMSYLKQNRRGGGWGSRGGGRGGGNDAGNDSGSADSSGYLYDYASAYGGRGRGRGGRSRGYQNNQDRNKRRPRTDLAPGMKGFICSTNFRESDCVREAYNILNEYDDQPGQPEPADCKSTLDSTVGKEVETELTEPKPAVVCTDTEDMEMDKDVVVEDSGIKIFGGSKNTTEGDKKFGEADDMKDPQETAEKSLVPKKDDDSDIDIDEELKREIAELKSDRVRKRFQCVDTGVKNVVFINSTIDDPNEIVYRIFEDVVSKKEARARYILRFLPVAASCHADMNAIQKVCKEVFEKDFKDGYKSFKIVTNIRNNNHMSKTEVIKTLADVVSEVNPLNFVDLTNPMFTITAEILKTVFCISVVKDFFKYKKFNLVEAATPDVPEGEVNATKQDDQEQKSTEEATKMDSESSDVKEANVITDTTDTSAPISSPKNEEAGEDVKM